MPVPSSAATVEARSRSASAEKRWWNLSGEEVSRHFESDLVGGLPAGRVKSHAETYGPNRLPEAKRISALKLFLNQFNNLIIGVLVAAAAVAGFLGEWMDAGAILVIVFLNGLLGFIQEYRAEKSLEALKRLASPTSKVVRNGAVQEIPSSGIVPGDLVLLEAGDRVPSDGRLVHAVQLRTQEASLTGESMPVEKDVLPMKESRVDLGDRRNMAFMGTAVVNGKGRMIVTETGLATELGKIAALLQTAEEEKTPLQQRLEVLGRRLVAIFLAVVAVVFVMGTLRGNPWGEMLLISLSLAVAAIPEGLPAVVTIALAIGVRKMAKRNALIRRLPSVETLGCATVICSDKTGTLTKNEMTVERIWVNERLMEVSGAGYAPQGEFSEKGEKILPEQTPELMKVLEIAVLCNDAELQPSGREWRILGDPTEGALLTVAAKGGMEKQGLESENPVITEIPFDSERKRMSVLRRTRDGPVLFVKGAPDIVLEHSTKIFLDGGVHLLARGKKELVTEANHRLASSAFRVLAVAYREGREMKDVPADKLEEDLVFVGLIAMMDPPRPEVRAAVETCRRAGIQSVMITGDHKETALAIARELGMIDERGLALSGAEIDALSQEALEEKVARVAVYARVSAEHKLRVVRAWKSRHAVVAMTGDGVNDAPAVKEADIGVAMGITGTDVTKEAADMVITDDHFSSIVNAVEEGRGIYDNIIKFVNYLLSSNLAEVLVLFFALLWDLRDPAARSVIPLTPLQILWMNLVTDGLPAVALGVDPMAPRAMEQPPRKPTEAILSLALGLRIAAVGLIIAAGSLAACLWGLRQSAELAQSMTLTTLIVLQLVRVQMVRSAYHMPLFSNRWLVAALLSSFLLQLGVLYAPGSHMVFGTVPLGAAAWGVILLIAFLVWWAGVGVNGVLGGLEKVRVQVRQGK
jgi:Ca2+-transporting ATPase